MTTIVNNPPAPKESGGGMTWIIGLVVFIVMAYVVFMYGIPALRNMQIGTPQINIPSTIDVNVNQQ